MTDIFDLVDRLWSGETELGSVRPFSHQGALVEIATDVAFVPNFANSSIFDTDDGLVMVDTGSQLSGQVIHDAVRTWSDQPLHSAVFSHGHVDHVFGVGFFEADAEQHGWSAPVVVAHEHIVHRFDRYIATSGYNQIVNRRQFGLPNLMWPVSYRYPDVTYRDTHAMDVGGRHFALRHERGETDDATVTWVSDRKILCTGDLFIWASPNAGNPQKVQRYPSEWASALRRMADLGAQYLLPGHGLPIAGAPRIKEALINTALYLESLVDQTVALMNVGARLSDIVANVTPPAALAGLPYLSATYDEPEFVVRNIWRLYGGWWDGNPANLKPATDTAVAVELAALSGGPHHLADRATELMVAGDDESVRLAGHLIELAWLASRDDVGIATERQAIFTKRAELSASTMSRGVFNWAARESTGETV